MPITKFYIGLSCQILVTSIFLVGHILEHNWKMQIADIHMMKFCNAKIKFCDIATILQLLVSGICYNISIFITHFQSVIGCI